MNIALYNLTTTTKYGGVESFVWELGRCLAVRGHAVTLFGGHGTVLRQYPGIAVRQYRYVARDTWGRSRLLRKSLNLLKLLERLSMAITALPDLQRGRYDIVQLSKPYDFPIGAQVQSSTTRVFYNSQGTDFFPGDRLFRRVIAGSYACSRYNAQMVEEHFYMPITVSYNGFDDQAFRPLPPDPLLRARFAPPEAPILFYAGRLVTFKGLDHLLDALALITRQPAPYLLLAGEGPHRASLEARARRLGIAERVRFLGSIPNADLPQYHAISDLFVLPSTDHETFGIVACEAMACERPVVAARTGGLPEVVLDGENGFLVPPADPGHLADRLNLLLEDAALRRRFGQAGRARVLEMFTWDRVTDRVIQCFVGNRA